MLRSVPKQEYLTKLQTRIDYNREVVETVFLPLSQTLRTRQPEPGEWSVDQCFQHLIVSFDGLSPNFMPALEEPEPADFDGIFRPSFLARRLNGIMFDPKKKFPTAKQYNPAESSEKTFYPDVLDRFLSQQEQLSNMVEQAAQADLQTMCWLMKFALLRYNLGDILYYLVSHDELHIGQAERALEAARLWKKTTNGRPAKIDREPDTVLQN